MFGSVYYVAVDYKCFVYYIGCMLIAKCRLQSHVYIYVIVIFYYLHKTYIQEHDLCLFLKHIFTPIMVMVNEIRFHEITQNSVCCDSFDPQKRSSLLTCLNQCTESRFDHMLFLFMHDEINIIHARNNILIWTII